MTVLQTTEKMEWEKHHTAETVSKSNNKVVEEANYIIPNTQIDDHLRSALGIWTSILKGFRDPNCVEAVQQRQNLDAQNNTSEQ